MRRALDQGEFQLWILFFVDGRTFRVVGGEALSRWNHPGQGLLHPSQFVPLLEREGRISQLDLSAMERACTFLERLGERQAGDFFLSCNISRKTFADAGFVRACRKILGRHAFPRKLLILEVTESGQLRRREEEQMLRNMVELRTLGLRVIFDDFGMGFSSFHDLQEYPVDGLKLDKYLVDNMETSQGRIILNALVRAGHELGRTILAEGVEMTGRWRCSSCTAMCSRAFASRIRCWRRRRSGRSWSGTDRRRSGFWKESDDAAGHTGKRGPEYAADCG